MGPRIIIDTNVFISALGWKGAPNKALATAIEHSCELIMPRKQLEEIRLVLLRPKLAFSDDERESIEDLIEFLDKVVDVNAKRKTSLGEIDDMLIDAAKQFEVHYLITGDANIRSEKRAGHANIVSPQEFIKALQ